MTQQNPKDTLQATLKALADVFETEDREAVALRPSVVARASPNRSGTSGCSPGSRTVGWHLDGVTRRAFPRKDRQVADLH